MSTLVGSATVHLTNLGEEEEAPTYENRVHDRAYLNNNWGVRTGKKNRNANILTLTGSIGYFGFNRGKIDSAISGIKTMMQEGETVTLTDRFFDQKTRATTTKTVGKFIIRSFLPVYSKLHNGSRHRVTWTLVMVEEPPQSGGSGSDVRDIIR